MSENPEAPVSEAEREDAVERLAALHREGLLGAHDFEDRRGRARDAETRGELRTLFRDLPPTGPDQGAAAAPAPAAVAQPAELVGPRPGTWFTKARRDAVSGIVVLAAVALFFTTGEWLWFLLIPASAALWKLVSGREEED
jgi:hypothetical protein